MSLTAVVPALASYSLQVTRELVDMGYDATGRHVAGTTGTAFIVAVYYPATGKELLRLPEGERTAQRMVFWTANPVYLRDVIRADAADWQVEDVEYTELTASYKAVGRRVGP